MPWLTTRRLLLAAIAAWLVVAVIGLAIGPPLGHDEAAFAVAARGDRPPGEWLYRPDGTVAIAWLGVALGGDEWQLRLASALLGTGIVVATFAVGRAAFTARTGAWAAALIAGAHPMALRSAQLLSDLPATAAVLGGMAVLLTELAHDSRDGGRIEGDAAGVDRDSENVAGPRWRIVAAAPLFAAGFYLRYGNAPVIALAIAAAGLLWWRAVAARPLRALAMLGVLAALLIPHVVRSIEATGSPLGILRLSAGLPRRAYLGEGLVDYFASNPFEFYGALIAPAMLAGFVGLVRARRRAPWFLAIVALGQLIALGVQSHGQPRYVFVATALLVVLGVAAVARFDRPRLAAAAAAAVAAAWLGVVVATVTVNRRAGPSRAPILHAADAVRADAAGRPCAIVAALAPQIVWYARCEVHPDELEPPLPADRTRYAVSFTRYPLDLDRILTTQHLRATAIPSGDPDARVWRLE
jgi:4-amino-4-deoxy-L-arabinose transferase-like glycosyltransferase